MFSRTITTILAKGRTKLKIDKYATMYLNMQEEMPHGKDALEREITDLLARCAHLEDRIDMLVRHPAALGPEVDGDAELFVPTDWQVAD